MTAIDTLAQALRKAAKGPATEHAEAWPGSEAPPASCLTDCPQAPLPPPPLSWRLERLAKASLTSRQLGREYLRSAISLLAAARGTRGASSADLCEARHAASRDRERRARKSIAFSALCRRRAARLVNEGTCATDEAA